MFSSFSDLSTSLAPSPKRERDDPCSPQQKAPRVSVSPLFFYLSAYFKDFFDVNHFLKTLLNLLQYYFCFGFFGPKACGIIVPWPGIEPAPPTLITQSLNHKTTGKSLHAYIKWEGTKAGRGKWLLQKDDYDKILTPVLTGCVGSWVLE